MRKTALISQKYEKYEKMFLDLKKENRFSRLGKPFQTKNKKYFFDSGTGKVFEVKDNVYSVLNCYWHKDNFGKIFDLNISENDLLSALEEIEEAVKAQNILLMPPVHAGNIKCPEITNVPPNHLIIEITQRCNMRCKYCIYHEGEAGYREFGSQDISFDSIRKAIDMMDLCPDEEISITFYGGEPLLRFDLIKQAIEYSKEKLNDKKLSFGITTNATLITEEIASYLASLENYFTLISLDGPKEIHDKNRIFPNGNGSFEETIKGLKTLINFEGEKASERINYNIVLSDDNKEYYEHIQSFFRNSGIIPENSVVNTSYVNKGSKENKYFGVGTEKEKEFTDKIKTTDTLTDWNIKEFISGNVKLDKNELISKETLNKRLKTIHSRLLTDQPIQSHRMNGCCTPAKRRIYVTTNGDFSICERMGPAPFIGNVDSGIDIEKIKKYYINDFINSFSKYCNECWAVHLCGLCYTNCYNQDGVNSAYRHKRCSINRCGIEGDLIRYHTLLEYDSDSISYLDDIEYS